MPQLGHLGLSGLQRLLGCCGCGTGLGLGFAGCSQLGLQGCVCLLQLRYVSQLLVQLLVLDVVPLQFLLHLVQLGQQQLRFFLRLAQSMAVLLLQPGFFCSQLLNVLLRLCFGRSLLQLGCGFSVERLLQLRVFLTQVVTLVVGVLQLGLQV